MSSASFQFLTVEKYEGNIYIITLSHGTDNKLNGAFCREVIRAFHSIHRELGPSEGAVITRGSSEKFWCNGIDVEDTDPWGTSDGVYPVRSPNSI